MKQPAHDSKPWELQYFQSSQEQFANYYLQYAQNTPAFDELEIEYLNLRETAAYLRTIQNHNLIIGLHEKLHTFMDLRGHWVDSLTFLDWAIDAAAELNDRTALARFTHDKADILNQGGNFKEAEALYIKSERIYIELSNIEMALRSRHMRSMVARAQGHLEAAEQLSESVIQDAEKQGLIAWLAHPYYVRALIARDKGIYDQARHWIEQSIPKLIRSEDKVMVAQCNHFLGELAFLQRDYDEAQKFLQISLQLSEEVGILRRIAATKRLSGDVARAKQDYSASLSYYQDALHMLEKLGDRPQISRTLFSLGQLAFAERLWGEAVSYFARAKHSYQNLNDPRGIVAACFFLMQLYFRQGHWLWAVNEMIDGIIAGLKGRLVSLSVIVGALKRWEKW